MVFRVGERSATAGQQVLFVVVAAANCSSTLSHSATATVPASGTPSACHNKAVPEGVCDPLSEETGVVLVLVVPHRVLPPLRGVRVCVCEAEEN